MWTLRPFSVCMRLSHLEFQVIHSKRPFCVGKLCVWVAILFKNILRACVYWRETEVRAKQCIFILTSHILLFRLQHRKTDDDGRWTTEQNNAKLLCVNIGHQPTRRSMWLSLIEKRKGKFNENKPNGFRIEFVWMLRVEAWHKPLVSIAGLTPIVLVSFIIVIISSKMVRPFRHDIAATRAPFVLNIEWIKFIYSFHSFNVHNNIPLYVQMKHNAVVFWFLDELWVNCHAYTMNQFAI